MSLAACMQRNSIGHSETKLNSHTPEGLQTVENEKDLRKHVSKVIDLYRDTFKNLGISLSYTVDWDSDDPKVASPNYLSKTEAVIDYYGKTLKDSALTVDALDFLTCHEIGHFIGGFPATNKLSYEGQSDYFAAQSCLKKLWGNEDNSLYEITISEKKLWAAANRCDEHWSNPSEKLLCHRIVRSGFNFMQAFNPSVSEKLSYDGYDDSIVETTFPRHPMEQCRLDTIMAASVCQVEFNDSLIPGFSFAEFGINSYEAQAEAFKYSCKEGAGARPKCWFSQNEVDPNSWNTDDSKFVKLCNSDNKTSSQTAVVSSIKLAASNRLRGTSFTPPSCERSHYEVSNDHNLEVVISNLDDFNTAIDILSEFKVQRLTVRYSCFANVEGLKKLSIEKLSLTNNTCGEFDLSSILLLENLTALDISYNKLEQKDLESVNSLKNLSRLNLSYNQLNNLEFMKEMKELTDLDLSYTDIDNISSLIGLHKLEKLSLYGTPISKNKTPENCPNTSKVSLAVSNFCSGEVFDK